MAEDKGKKKKLSKKEQDKINLHPIQKGQLSNEELKKRQSNGGKKGSAARRQKKLLRETLEELLLMNNPETGENNQLAINVALVQQALKGNTKAYEVIRDTLGQKQPEKVETNTTVQKVFITPQEQQEVDKHIDDVINS